MNIYRLRPRRPTLKKSVATLSSQDTGDTLKGETSVDQTDQVGDVYMQRARRRRSE